MAIISINQLLQLNQNIKEQQIPFKIHLRDACGKQSLWIEALNTSPEQSQYDNLYELLEDFTKTERITIQYSDDKKSFWVL